MVCLRDPTNATQVHIGCQFEQNQFRISAVDLFFGCKHFALLFLNALFEQSAFSSPQARKGFFYVH